MCYDLQIKSNSNVCLSWTQICVSVLKTGYDRVNCSWPRSLLIVGGHQSDLALSGLQLKHMDRFTCSLTHNPSASLSILWLCLPASLFFFISIFLTGPLRTNSSTSSPWQEDEINAQIFLILYFKGFCSQQENVRSVLQHHLSPFVTSCC